MKIALAALVLCPALLAAGCKKKPLPPPPPNPVIGEWACTIRSDKAKAKFDAAFAENGALTVKMSISATSEGKELAARLDATGSWAGNSQAFTQRLDNFTVHSSTSNGDGASDSAAKSLANRLQIEGQDLAIEKLDDTDFVYVTKGGTVSCKR
ncbi:MAG: hypothetical protein Q8R02_12950 [Hyphomonadaceae bacterium]|nr:hypothetical protein [Hyphomonadaceae bacterium]